MERPEEKWYGQEGVAVVVVGRGVVVVRGCGECAQGIKINIQGHKIFKGGL
jgi:hypothetical protein